MTVKLCLPVDEPAWDAYVHANPRANGYHQIAWRRIIDETFGHPTHYLMAESGGRITGVLPAARLKSPLFGDFLVSLPFVNYGGAVADDDGVVRELMGALADLGRTLGVDHVEVRTETDTDYGLRARSAKVSMRKRLPATADDLWKSFNAKLRNQIKRGQQEAMTVRIGREDELDAFYEVFSINMRDLGTPVYSRRLFASVLHHLPESSWICTVWVGSTPVAAGFLVGFRDVLEIPWASSLRRYNKLSPNMLLYWSVLKFAAERGFRVFDFGRSSPDSGTYKFKAQWGAEPVPLYWHYWVRDDGPLPELNPQNPKYQLAVRTWQRLPLWLTRLIGPSIVMHLP
jgi:serine/alanine adding enzyme